MPIDIATTSRAMPSFLIDASVALKWFMPVAAEPDAQRAREFVGALEMRMTTLTEYEVANRLVRGNAIAAAEVAGALALLRDICGEPEQLVDADRMLAAELCADHGLTFYDASYAAISQRSGRTLVSADRDLLGPGLAVAIADVGLD